MKTTILLLPNDFQGFYESHLSNIIDSYEDSELSYLSDELFVEHKMDTKELDLYQYLECDYTMARNSISMLYTETFVNLVSLSVSCPMIDSIKYNSLESPRFYNFETDKLLVDIDINELTLRNYARDNFTNFCKYLEDNFKSCDGFSSFYSYDSREWFNGSVKAKSEFIYYTYLFDFYLTNIISKINNDPSYGETPMEDIMSEVIDHLHCESSYILQDHIYLKDSVQSIAAEIYNS